jgi:hypothetical protein
VLAIRAAVMPWRKDCVSPVLYKGAALWGRARASDAVTFPVHRASPGMNCNFREGVWKMGEITGTILRDLVRQRRRALRHRRSQIIRSLPKSAYARLQALFGRRTLASSQAN